MHGDMTSTMQILWFKHFTIFITANSPTMSIQVHAPTHLLVEWWWWNARTGQAAWPGSNSHRGRSSRAPNMAARTVGQLTAASPLIGWPRPGDAAGPYHASGGSGEPRRQPTRNKGGIPLRKDRSHLIMWWVVKVVWWWRRGVDVSRPWPRFSPTILLVM